MAILIRNRVAEYSKISNVAKTAEIAVIEILRKNHLFLSPVFVEAVNRGSETS